MDSRDAEFFAFLFAVVLSGLWLIHRKLDRIEDKIDKMSGK